jgi:hypothetical protein
LLRGALPLEPCPQLFFTLTIFQIKSKFLPGLNLKSDPPTYDSHVAEITDTHHFAQFAC